MNLSEPETDVHGPGEGVVVRPSRAVVEAREAVFLVPVAPITSICLAAVAFFAVDGPAGNPSHPSRDGAPPGLIRPTSRCSTSNH